LKQGAVDDGEGWGSGAHDEGYRVTISMSVRQKFPESGFSPARHRMTDWHFPVRCL
jgi:hypothetical protein